MKARRWGRVLRSALGIRRGEVSWHVLGWFVSCLHLSWGILLWVSPDAERTTPLYAVTSGLSTFGVGHRYAAGAVLIIAALAAFWGFTRPGRLGQLVVLPQQLLLILVAVGAVQAAIRGSYPDGVPRPGLFILADQMSSVLLVCAHALAVVGRWWRRAPESSDRPPSRDLMRTRKGA